MKKNILTIVIMAAALVNLILSIVLVFSIMPAMNKTSRLVDKVSSVIDLEIESGKDEEQEYTIADLTPIEVTYETSVKINLQPEGDKAHYCVLDGIVVSLNSKAKDYKDINKSLGENNVYVSDIVKEVISGYPASTIDEVTVRQEAVKRLQEKYNTKAIVEISLPGFLVA